MDSSAAYDKDNSCLETFAYLCCYIVSCLSDRSEIRLALYSPIRHGNKLQASSSAFRRHTALELQAEDLISEGIDFHCDGEIVKYVSDR